jgi:hypothetical protein
VRLNKSNFNAFKAGNEIKILLDVIDSGIYHIMFMTEDAEPLLQNGEQVDDLVGYNSIQCYRYYVKDMSTNVELHLKTYSGRVDMLINPSTRPDKMQDFLIKADNDTDEIVNLNPWIRSHRA